MSEGKIIANCQRCGEATELPAPLTVGGSPVYFARFCEPCIQAAREEEERRKVEEAAARVERERAYRQERILNLLYGIGVNPWEHGGCELANFDTSESGNRPRDAVREFLAAVRDARKYEPVRGLYLWGDTGCGKSHLAIAVARDLLLDPAFDPSTIVFDHALGLITKIQETYNSGASTEEILTRRINARVWILDDLGTEQASDDVVRRLTLIFTERAGRPTLVTSNDPPERLEIRHQEYFRLASRLGPAYFRTIEIRGRDRRFDIPREAV